MSAGKEKFPLFGVRFSCVYASPLFAQYFNVFIIKLADGYEICVFVSMPFSQSETKTKPYFSCFRMCVCLYVCLHLSKVKFSVSMIHFLQLPFDITLAAPSGTWGKIVEYVDHNVNSKLDPDLLPGLATPPSSTFKLHHHDGDVVGAAAVERLEDDALGAKMRLIQTLADEPDSLLVAESVPQAIGR